ncbi:MAG: hypothetical protein IPM02_13000 [Betaproteobacteria bacterium]|nr:hypothetical protein [Betaproteobacteria bacterium]
MGLIPRIENSDVRAGYAPTQDRVDLWIRQHIHVLNRPEWIFVKVHTHGTQERDMEALLGPPLEAMFGDLEARYNDGHRYVLHYVSTREMFNIIKAAGGGAGGQSNRLPRLLAAEAADVWAGRFPGNESRMPGKRGCGPRIWGFGPEQRSRRAALGCGQGLPCPGLSPGAATA